MVKQIKIAIIVDNPKRDLAANTLLANELVLRGFRVFLVPLYIQSRELIAIKPHITILNYHRKGNDWLVDFVLKLQSKVFILETEGAVFSDFDKTKEIYSDNEYLKSSIEGYFIWGEKIYTEFVRHNIYPKEKLFLTGSPRTDLLSPSFKNAVTKILFNELNPVEKEFFEKRYFLINSNNALINGKISNEQETKLHLQKSFGYSESYINELFDEQYEKLNETIRITNKLAAKFPNERFILRPHPFENESYYKYRLNNLKNVLVSNTGSIDGWLSNCKAIIMKNCSTALEGAINGVPVISMDWMKHIHNVCETEMVSHKAKSVEEVFSLVEKINRGKLKPTINLSNQIKDIVSNLYYKNDGNNHKRISDIIEVVANSTMPSINSKVIFQSLNSKYHLSARIKNIFRINKYFSFKKMKLVNPNINWIKSDFYFNEHHVNNILQSLNASSIAIKSNEKTDEHYIFSSSIEII